MESKKEVKKEVFISVERNLSKEVTLIGFREKGVEETYIVNPWGGTDMDAYVNILNLVKNEKVLKVIEHMDVIEGLERLMSTQLNKEEWLALTTLAKDLGFKNNENVSDIAKDLKIEQAKETQNERQYLKNRINTGIKIYAELMEKKKKDALEKVKKNLWKKQLEYVETGKDKKKKIKDSLKNALTIMLNDPKINMICYNTFAHSIEINERLNELAWDKDEVYWNNIDWAQLVTYITLAYGPFKESNLNTAFQTAYYRRKFHPVVKYLESVKPKWDGKNRLETWLIKHLGVEDCLYTREVSKKVLLGAVARVYKPGTKFDTMLVLDGPQGNGKSTMLQKLGVRWHSDSVELEDLRGKVAAEKLQGNWIIEIEEMTGMRKVDIDALKAFLSTLNDRYRPPYGRVVENHPRQCVIIGTINSNDRGFLRDPSGDRRYWPVKTKPIKKNMKDWKDGDEENFVRLENASWNITDDEINQLWAEAAIVYEQEKNNKDLLILSLEAEQYADKVRRSYIEGDPREGQVEQFLEMLLPIDWDNRTINQRRIFISQNIDGNKDIKYVGTEKRTVTCAVEIYQECFGKDLSMGKMSRNDSTEIGQILRKLGWEMTKPKRFKRYGTQRAFEKVDNM